MAHRVGSAPMYPWLYWTRQKLMNPNSIHPTRPQNEELMSKYSPGLLKTHKQLVNSGANTSSSLLVSVLYFPSEIILNQSVQKAGVSQTKVK